MAKITDKQRACLEKMATGAALVCSNSPGTDKIDCFVEGRPSLSVHGATVNGLMARGLIRGGGSYGQFSTYCEITDAGRAAIAPAT
ncbi:MAG TPA: hypothetical protein VIR04_00495 [Paralcaligenes sp.]